MTDLLEDMYVCTFDKGQWHWKHIFCDDLYNLAIKFLVRFPYEEYTFKSVLAGDTRGYRFGVIVISPEDVSIILTAIMPMGSSMLVGHVYILQNALTKI